ncbi:protein-ADP-ribose hydrolase [Aerococcus kribbianus]|uniref:Protein-ADP-ribose hydrolase n=1 Tax=Aerococcus kribbianus TaxID=2999064 RepID=A0A9X3JFI3_9LACT|nr:MULTISPECIES: protein-ADP-ribose hydrolase [unclassified Aerococcus]MCZ0717112.1 protein-ADP-ribose hydrolase [Aerococcus sp. YH-aer221]MCZ0725400.1 protein-ADP-ribose hydrolase [Aerococcus sp. YH-aer222]
MTDQELSDKLNQLIAYLASENPKVESHFSRYPNETWEDKYEIFRGYCNIRPPQAVPNHILSLQDELLQALLSKRDIVSLDDLTAIQEQIYLWQGDITCLAVDGIVNAANSALLGCTQANHNCIDNAIHTRAGMQLRLDCHQIIKNQGRKEAMGKAKITPAYNLPAQYVLHTVGPYIDEGGVSPLKENLLASSYRSCLQLADQEGLESLAFCCISTGEFHYPNDQAAQVAIETVKTYLNENNSSLKVIFNVFLDKDLEIYQDLLEQ